MENKAFIAMNQIVGHDILLSYPNFSEIIRIYIDASKMQLRGG